MNGPKTALKKKNTLTEKHMIIKLKNMNGNQDKGWSTQHVRQS